jgi:hypothetical protein
MITSERLPCGCEVRKVSGQKDPAKNGEKRIPCPTHATESLVRLANKYGYLMTEAKSRTHRVMRHDKTGEELEIEFLAD